MADTNITRAFIPPTESEVIAGETKEIVWSLGTATHPWKNIYIMDYDVDKSVSIDVYAALKDVASMPKGDREAGMVLTVDTNSKDLVWKKINDVLRTYASGEVLTSIIASNVVQRAQGDEDGVQIKTAYLKIADFTAAKIATVLDSFPVQRATADADGKVFKDNYVDKVYVANNYIKKGGLRDEGVLAEIAFTGAWEDIQGRPAIPDFNTVRQMISNEVDPLKVRVTACEVDLQAIHTDLTAIHNELDNTVVHKTDLATTTTKGILSVDTTNGLSISNGVLTIDKATNSKLGAVKVKNGNGLNLANTGEITMNVATTSTAGAVKLGIVYGYSSGSVTQVPADGQLYRWRGIPTGSGVASQWWFVRRIQHTEITNGYFIWAQSNEDPRLELRSNDNGNTWYAPYATWHA